MKNILLIAILFIYGIGYSQQHYDLNTPNTSSKKLTYEQMIGKSVKSKDTAKYKDTIYPVYTSTRGNKFIVYKNSKGNYTKKYIKQ